ncbi:hypothetical protein [Rhizobium sp. Root1204]|uniref:hypothetical protein n=1 Tax=Rhizobium sp. Root1204 TaxID=1736428 RepID=UPI0007126F22|nr:hypothetical protein [Rhizobium sp. Root1204]KQV34513.1 hypothetical protein ASC96_30240 [Rhizobium sp. Root1204]
MTDDKISNPDEPKTLRLSAAEFASEPRSFVRHLAERMAVDISDSTLHRLVDRVKRGATREQIIQSLYNAKGERYPTDKATAALNFSRVNVPAAALVVENVLLFAPNDEKAFVLHAYRQVLSRHPGEVELARLVHQLESETKSRLDLLALLNAKAIEEGHLINWDSAASLQSREGDIPKVRGLIETSGFRVVSHSTLETLTLCRYLDERWELAPSMIARAEEFRSDSWVVKDGFILSGPKCHVASGCWALELDIVQPEWATLAIDVVANVGADRLFYVSARGNLRGSFVFEKLNTHAFLEVRLQVQDSVPEQWISIQSVKLRRLD